MQSAVRPCLQRLLRPQLLPRSNLAPRVLRAAYTPIAIQSQSRFQLRHASTSAPPPQPLPHRPAPHRNPDEPVYELTFTCKACQARTAHTVSKQGYHHGTVLITCPGCKNRHLIADHLKIFSDQAITLEDIMAQGGQSIQKGSIDAKGDVEFWPPDDNSARKR